MRYPSSTPVTAERYVRVMALAAAADDDRLEVSFDKRFLGQLNRLQAPEIRKVTKAIDRFNKDQRHPSLNLEQIKADESLRLYTIRASDELRILLARIGSKWVVLEAGHHDAIYLRASTGRFIANPNGFIGFVTTVDDPSAERQRRTTETEPDPEPVFGLWSAADLLEAGFDDETASLLLDCNSHTELLDLDIEDELLMKAIDLVEVSPKTWRKRGGGRATKDEVAEILEENGADWGLSRHFSEEELDKILSGPIEQWMIFLHPRQEGIVAGRYEGPARIGGPAGTGKTVVALHRAAELAHRFRQEDPDAKILFTTFITSLSAVFEELYRQLPNSIPGAVEFVNIDAKARQICKSHGVTININTKNVKEAFDAAFKKVITPKSTLGQSKIDKNYLKEEVTAVIKGRGMKDLGDYLAVERTGRRFAFPEAYRRQVWDLHQAWEAEMKTRKTRDFPDVLSTALELTRADGKAMYRGAIIDEAQDLSLTGLNLVRSLVNGDGPDPSDGLLLVGDGAQRIYTSCYTLSQAGLEVRGRTTILKRNYRNARPIVTAAMAVAGDRTIDDLGDEFKRGDAGAVSELEGDRPRVLVCSDLDSQWDRIVAEVRAIVDNGSVGYGDIGILLPVNRFVYSGENRLRERGFPVINLKNFAAHTTDEIRIGTYYRAKGLEFKVVILPDVSIERLPSPQRKTENDDAYQERLDMEMSAFYVAMSRARDKLILTCSDQPAAAISGAKAHFDFE
jgi:hypothetical protein